MISQAQTSFRLSSSPSSLYSPHHARHCRYKVALRALINLHSVDNGTLPNFSQLVYSDGAGYDQAFNHHQANFILPVFGSSRWWLSESTVAKTLGIHLAHTYIIITLTSLMSSGVTRCILSEHIYTWNRQTHTQHACVTAKTAFYVILEHKFSEATDHSLLARSAPTRYYTSTHSIFLGINCTVSTVYRLK